jgi:hypothetical protein
VTQPLTECQALLLIEEQLDHLLGELTDGPGSSRDKVQYATTVSKNILVLINELFPMDELSEFHLDEEDVEHVNEGFC